MGQARSQLDKTLVGPTLHVDHRKSDHRIAVTLPTVRVAAGPDMLEFANLHPPDGQVVIGRDTACDLTLSDGSVSRRHARIGVDASGGIYVEDLGSTNGTRVRGVGLEGIARLQIGDTFSVGGVTLKLEQLSLKELSHLTKVVQRLSLANKDALTGLVTRRYLDEELPSLLHRHQVSEVPLSALFVDIDHFKRINDTWGHATGDDVLRALARLLAMNVRDADTCVRYGGEEFVAVLVNCDEAGAVHSAERLREQVEAHDWTAYADGLRVTISAGASQALQGENQDHWLERADTALYAAKHGGRNRCIAASTLGGGPHLL